MLPANIEAITPDDLPSGVFLYPLCTSRENFELMLIALDTVYKNDKENVGVIKDFLNAQEYAQNPLEQPCLEELLQAEAPPLPAILEPLERTCIRIELPAEQAYFDAFFAQLNAMTDPDFWQGSEVDRQTAATLWAGVIETAVQNFEAGDCTLPLEFRVVGGQVEYRADPGAGWTAIGEACPCPSPITQPAYNPDNNTAELLSCAIATGMVTWLFNKYGDTIDEIVATGNQIAAYDSILLIFPPAYLIADIILDSINEIISVGASVALAADTTELREAITEYLYCEMLVNGDGEMTDEIWNDFKTELANGTFGSGLGMAAIDLYMRSFESAAIQARSRIESYGSGNCVAFACNEFEHTFDFTVDGSQGWVIEQGTFSAQFNSHFIDLGSGGGISRYREILQIKREWTGTRQITRVTAYGAITGVPGSLGSNERRLRGVSGVSQLFEYFTGANPDWNWTVSSTSLVDELNIRLQVAKGTSFSGCDITITKVVVEGIGSDPF